MLIVAGCFGAYALGANSTANVTGVMRDLFDRRTLVLLGGMSIALGVVTYSRNVMMTVGRNLVQLDAFTALVAVLAQASTVYIFARIGVPVSTSQAIVGSVVGIGLVRGIRTISKRTLVRIGFGWIGTPLIGGAVCFAATGFFL